MKKCALVIICGLFLFVGSVSAFEVKRADIFWTPQTTSSNWFGGLIGGRDAGFIDWSIGNCVPPDGRRTDGIVISTCDGDPASAESWTGRVWIDHNPGIMVMSPDGTKWRLLVDDGGNVVTVRDE